MLPDYPTRSIADISVYSLQAGGAAFLLCVSKRSPRGRAPIVGTFAYRTARSWIVRRWPVMTSRMRTSPGGAAALIACVCLAAVPMTVKAQSAAAKEGSTQRTPWGDPDLQGVWTTWDETPFEAPEPSVEGPRISARTSDAFRKGVANASGSGMAIIYYGPVSPRRPGGLVVDPPNGKVPLIRREKENEAQTVRLMQDNWIYHSAWERCISHGVPGRVLQAGIGGYDRSYRILQTPRHVAIFTEDIHETRIVQMDGRPHVNSTIRLWNGDSRGHWEGATLVVETTNFNGKNDTPGGGRQTEALRMVERFTRIDAKTLNYEVTFEDPNVYTRPWTARQPHNFDPNYRIQEYACHEGNRRFMEGSLEQGRVRDAEEAQAAAKKKAGN